jgi:hypothetical protein
MRLYKVHAVSATPQRGDGSPGFDQGCLGRCGGAEGKSRRVHEHIPLEVVISGAGSATQNSSRFGQDRA